MDSRQGANTAFVADATICAFEGNTTFGCRRWPLSSGLTCIFVDSSIIHAYMHACTHVGTPVLHVSVSMHMSMHISMYMSMHISMYMSVASAGVGK